MENTATVLWNGKKIGRITNIVVDMWYLDADWLADQSDEAKRFEDMAFRLDAKEVMKSPSEGMIVHLQYDDSTSKLQNVLILSLDKSKIFMRHSISDKAWAYLDLNVLAPWQRTDSSSFYEEELRKEVGFFHPLYWKKVRTVGIRTDCDDVLFEVHKGRYKYAVVHLTYAKEQSRKFPVTCFYKDWNEVYQKRLLKDHEEWKMTEK